MDSTRQSWLEIYKGVQNILCGMTGTTGYTNNFYMHRPVGYDRTIYVKDGAER